MSKTTSDKKWFRTPEDGEWIEYDCGCIYEINRKGKSSNFSVDPNFFCMEHDPTLTQYAKENEDEFVEENY